MRILVVEDDLIIGSLISEMLVELGHEVCGLETTEMAAIAAASRDKPQLMIVDRQLREGDGTSTMRAVLRAGPVAYIFMTGERRVADNPDAVMLYKPFREVDLRVAIERAVSRR
ncbi:response regulator [Acidisoma cladoniae]|uniref:response regulator n=1 Tax=Acidisoma cladoniae TaxID=3040935 RepID=UPI00254CC5E1|nr:response regulator [Acidisoma sp. PAMC 29798]